MNPFQMVNQLKKNPYPLLSRRYKIPPNMNFNSSDDIIKYLMDTGQLTQQQYNIANQQLSVFKKNNNMM